MKWIKTHKYWTTIIILFVILTLPVVIVGGENINEQYPFLFLFFWFFALLGGIIWSILTKRKGMTLLTIGSFMAVLGVIGLYSTLLYSYDPEYGVANAVLWGLPTLLGILCLFFGIKRYVRRLKPGMVKQSEKIIKPKVFHEQVSKEEQEVREAKGTTSGKRWPKIYKILGIVFIVVGVLTLLWSIIFYILTGLYEILHYLLGATMAGIGCWYYFWMSKLAKRK